MPAPAKNARNGTPVVGRFLFAATAVIHDKKIPPYLQIA